MLPLAHYAVQYQVYIFATDPHISHNPHRCLRDAAGNTIYPQQDIQSLSVQHGFGGGAGNATGVDASSGTWAITLAPRREWSTGRTWADVIKPMDYVEIYLSNHKLPAGQLPHLVMRGFVQTVTESI